MDHRKPGKFLNYTLTEKLGSGAFGEVWLAKDSSGKKIALKFLSIYLDQKLHVDLFKQEFSLLSELRHQNLAQVFDFGISPKKDHYYFTQEYCPGKTLLEACDKKPLEFFESILVQVLAALDYIHSAGVVHFDIKADNILVTEKEGLPSAKILDFGIAARLQTLPKIVGGTPTYMAPELIALSSHLDHRVDLYALGMLCLRALTGKVPFQGDDLTAIKEWHLHGALPRDIWDGLEIPKHLRELTEKLLAKNPDDRFSTARVALNFINRTTGGRYQELEQGLQNHIPAEGPLVGRAALLENLKSTMNDAWKGQGTASPLVCLHGEPGIGKSRLLDEVKRIVELAEIRYLLIRSHPNRPSWPQIASFFGLNLSASEPSDETSAIRYRIDALLQAAQDEPLALLIDDLDTGDKQTRKVIKILRKQTGSKLFVLTTSQKILEGSLEIKRLQPSDITNYVQQTLGPVDNMEAIAKQLFQYSGGLPLLMAEGLGQMAPQILKNIPLEELSAPPQIGSLYATRLASVSKDTRELLNILVLLSRPSTLEELSTLLHKQPLAVMRCLHQGRQKGLIKPPLPFASQTEQIELSNQALGLEIMSLQGIREKKKLHQLIASSLEKNKKASLVEIAFHFAASGDSRKGQIYYEKAAHHLVGEGHLMSATENFIKALALSETDSKVWKRIALQASHQLIQTGQLAKASDILNQWKDRKNFEFEKVRGWLAFKQRDFETAELAYEKALTLRPKLNRLQEILIRNALGNVALQSSQLSKAHAIFTQSSQLEKKLSKTELNRVDNNNLGLVLSLLDKHEEALSFYQNRLKRISAKQNTERINLLSGLGFALIHASKMNEAIESLCEAEQLAEETGTRHSLFSILGNLITATFKEGRYGQALDWAKKMGSLQKRLGSERDVAYNLLRQGDLYLILGMEEAAEKCFEEGLAQAVSLSDEGLTGWFFLMQGYRERDLDSLDQAGALFQQALSQANLIKDNALKGLAQYALAELKADQGDWNEAQAGLGAIQNLKLDDEFEVRRGLLQARLDLENQKRDEAESSFQVLEARCIQKHLHELLWELYYYWGLSHQDSPPLAEAYFKKGVGLLKSIAELLPEEYRDRYLQQKTRRALYTAWKALNPVTETWPDVPPPTWGETNSSSKAETTVVQKR